MNIAYDALRDLCSSRHGDAKELVRSVLRRLLPAASLQHASSGPTPAVSVPKLASNAQASVLQFLRYSILALQRCLDLTFVQYFAER